MRTHRTAEQRRQQTVRNIVRLLREERERAGLSMSAVAERAGLSQQMISYVERGLRMPTLDTLLRITDALNLNLLALLRKAGFD